MFITKYCLLYIHLTGSCYLTLCCNSHTVCNAFRCVKQCFMMKRTCCYKLPTIQNINGEDGIGIICFLIPAASFFLCAIIPYRAFQTNHALRRYITKLLFGVFNCYFMYKSFNSYTAKKQNI